MPVLANDDFYDILGVPSDASTDDIRAAYQRLALAHHPDKQLQQQPNAAAAADPRAFIRITEAWNTLRDDELRRVYDAELFQERLGEVPTVHQVLGRADVRRSPDGTGWLYACRCGVECRIDTHANFDDNWRYNTCDECSHVVELDLDGA